jgi:hypothetical protein
VGIVRPARGRPKEEKKMKVEIENIAGGDRRSFRSLAQMARMAARYAPYGGWRITSCEGIAVEDVRRVLNYTRLALRSFLPRPRTADEWRRVADTAIRMR